MLPDLHASSLSLLWPCSGLWFLPAHRQHRARRGKALIKKRDTDFHGSPRISTDQIRENRCKSVSHYFPTRVSSASLSWRTRICHRCLCALVIVFAPLLWRCAPSRFRGSFVVKIETLNSNAATRIITVRAVRASKRLFLRCHHHPHPLPDGRSSVCSAILTAELVMLSYKGKASYLSEHLSRPCLIAMTPSFDYTPIRLSSWC